MAALMDYDEENILISLYIQSVSKAKVITKVNNASFDSILHGLKIKTIIHPKNLTGRVYCKLHPCNAEIHSQ